MAVMGRDQLAHRQGEVSAAITAGAAAEQFRAVRAELVAERIELTDEFIVELNKDLAASHAIW